MLEYSVQMMLAGFVKMFVNAKYYIYIYSKNFNKNKKLNLNPYLKSVVFVAHHDISELIFMESLNFS